MKEHYIATTKTARYYTLGELNDSTENVWILLHGYAQLAKEFIVHFEELNNGKNFIIAPEGLNRFYSKGFSGKPVATWMTSEDRLNEINDYVHYLDRIYEELAIGNKKVKTILLGFSQGVATASRWLHFTNNHIDHFVIYAGEMGAEILSPLSGKIKNIPLTYVTGNQDPLITRESHLKVFELMQSLQATIIEFEGGHEVRADVIRRIVL